MLKRHFQNTQHETESRQLTGQTLKIPDYKSPKYLQRESEEL
jgi:hypothetical protein